MKFHFIKGKESGSDLQVAVSNEQSDKFFFKGLWKVDPKKRVLCIMQVFLICWTAFDNGF